MFYHVIIWREPGGELVHRAPNLEWPVVSERVLPAYEAGTAVTLGGRTIGPQDIGGMRILETDDQVNPTAPLDDDYLRMLGCTYHESERDITDRWIVGPPGHARQQSEAVQNETLSWTRIFDALITTEEIRSASRQLFADGHHQNAVEDALKTLDRTVARKSGIADSGTSLMRKAFGGKTPRIALNQLETETENGIQEGYGHLFAGSMQAIRNPRAHGLDVDQPHEALELIVLANHLMSKIHSAPDRVKGSNEI